MDHKKLLIRTTPSEKDSLSPDNCEFRDIDLDINNCLSKIKETNTRMKRLVRNIDNFSRLKRPHFTQSQEYLAGKQMIYKKKHELNDFQRIQREKYILSLLQDNDPGKKKYIYTSMLYDSDIRNALKQSKREFGFKNKQSATFASDYIETLQSPDYKHDHARHLNYLVSKNLDKILYNHTYYTSPIQWKKSEMKKVEDGLISPISKNQQKIHKKSATACVSPAAEKNTVRRRRKVKRLTMNIRDEVKKKQDELSNLKKQFSRLLLMKK
ncbi:unnamed protein product [Blepharisma stoltei]|uniref:Uncharacterized protein n=1 Tax=Blepharisma stoltei TaxID=1481888 RepID=A0AAU9J2A9_9CILI|nr:unnamed protein product [Blepharisma stoltei]